MKKATKKTFMRFLLIFMIALLIMSNPGILDTHNGQAAAEVDYNSLPPLLITELVPQSSNVDGKNAYEYIEVYNNTNQTINFADYQIIYRYPTGPEDDMYWTPENRNVDIPPGKTLVLWVKPAHEEINALTDEDFNNNYGTNLTMDENLVDMPNSGAMHNQRMRDIVIRTNTGKEVVRAQYNKAEFDVQKDKGILYSYPEDGSNKMIKESAGEVDGTPGTVADGLVPDQPVSVDDDIAPVIDDQTISPQPLDQVEVKAKASDDFLLSTLTLKYRKLGDEDFKTLSLENPDDDGVFSQTLPLQNMTGAEEIEYYFEATNGLNTKETDKSTIMLETAENDNTPPLLVTELAPDSQNIDGANAYEFIEVYNNTDQPIDFGNFHVLYRYPSGTEDLIWFDDLEGEIIEPAGNLVLWIDNGKNSEADAEMFKNNYGITEDINLVKAPAGGGMANGAERDLVIATNTGEEIVSAGYNKPGDKNDVIKDMGIFYHYPIDSNEMIKVRAGETATPGTVEADLVPEDLLSVNPDAETTFEDQTDVEVVIPGESIDIVSHADNAFLITDMTLKYKYSNEETFTTVDLQRDSEGLFRHTLNVNKDVEAEYIEYYFEAENGFTSTESDHQQVDIEITSVPGAPSNPTPANDAVDVEISPTLSVQVSDKLGGALDVTFYQGKSFNSSQTEQVKIFQNATDVEPPTELVPEGETEFSEEDYKKLSELNGEKVSLDSEKQFPYQRFEVTVDEASLDKEFVEAVWYGSSLEGRQVSLYAWNLDTEKWDLIDRLVAESDDTFMLSGDVSVADYVDGETLNILVQDEVQFDEIDSEFDKGDEPNFTEFDFNFAWLADTQFYTEVFPWHFENQVEWIADHKDDMNIEYVFHSGDIVNTWNQEYQWEYADQYMKILEDADVPYGILAGNHDVELPEMNYTNYYKYFGEDRFVDQPHYGGSFQNNRGHYDLISVQGIDFIMVHMGWQPQDDGIAWMNEVLEAHSDRIAILNFHQYLDETKITPMGQRIFDEVVVPNDNVQLVVGGHHTGSNAMSQKIEGTDRVVYELMGNFQDESEGGLGYLNMMSVDIESNSLYITSYSPSEEAYNFFSDTPYRIPLELNAMTKNVATDYFEVNSYAGEEIDSVSDVASDQVAEVTWSDLENGTPYSWYVSVTNQDGNEIMSDMWHFQTENLSATEIESTPVIYADDVTITKGDEFDPSIGVFAVDAHDGDLTEKIEIDTKDLNTNKVGDYEVVYMVSNSQGATFTKTITVTVVEKDEISPPTEEPKDPDESIDPGDQNDNGSVGRDKTDGNESSGQDEGDALPVTATHTYTWLLIGMILIAAAGVTSIIYHRRRKI